MPAPEPSPKNSIHAAAVAGARRRDLLQTAVVLCIALTPGWLLPPAFGQPWIAVTLLGVGPLLALSWLHGPWVPTPKADLPRIVRALALAPGASFCDLGCGDGRVLAWVHRATGARCTGFEAAPFLALIARVRAYGSRGEIRVRIGDLYAADLSVFDAIYVWGAAYSVGAPRFRELLARSARPGTRLVSYQTPVAGLDPIEVDREGKRPVWIYRL